MPESRNIVKRADNLFLKATGRSWRFQSAKHPVWVIISNIRASSKQTQSPSHRQSQVEGFARVSLLKRSCERIDLRPATHRLNLGFTGRWLLMRESISQLLWQVRWGLPSTNRLVVTLNLPIFRGKDFHLRPWRAFHLFGCTLPFLSQSRP